MPKAICSHCNFEATEYQLRKLFIEEEDEVVVPQVMAFFKRQLLSVDEDLNEIEYCHVNDSAIIISVPCPQCESSPHSLNSMARCEFTVFHGKVSKFFCFFEDFDEDIQPCEYLGLEAVAHRRGSYHCSNCWAQFGVEEMQSQVVLDQGVLWDQCITHPFMQQAIESRFPRLKGLAYLSCFARCPVCRHVDVPIDAVFDIDACMDKETVLQEKSIGLDLEWPSFRERVDLGEDAGKKCGEERFNDDRVLIQQEKVY